MSDGNWRNTQVGAPDAELPVPPGCLEEPLPTPSEDVDDVAARAAANGPKRSASSSGARAKPEFGSFIHKYILENIRFADQKATFVFAGTVAWLAFLYDDGVALRWLKAPISWSGIDVIAFLGMSALAVGASCAFCVIVPRTKGSRRGLVFWEAVAEYETGESYGEDLMKLSVDRLFLATASHCVDLAKVCRAKYRVLKWSLLCGVFGLTASLLAVLLGQNPATLAY